MKYYKIKSDLPEDACIYKRLFPHVYYIERSQLDGDNRFYAYKGKSSMPYTSYKKYFRKLSDKEAEEALFLEGL